MNIFDPGRGFGSRGLSGHSPRPSRGGAAHRSSRREAGWRGVHETVAEASDCAPGSGSGAMRIFKVVVFALLALNVVVFLWNAPQHEAVDQLGWVILLSAFLYETSALDKAYASPVEKYGALRRAHGRLRLRDLRLLFLLVDRRQARLRLTPAPGSPSAPARLRRLRAGRIRRGRMAPAQRAEDRPVRRLGDVRRDLGLLGIYQRRRPPGPARLLRRRPLDRPLRGDRTQRVRFRDGSRRNLYYCGEPLRIIRNALVQRESQ